MRYAGNFSMGIYFLKCHVAIDGVQYVGIINIS